MKKLSFLFLVIASAANSQELYRIAQYSSNPTLFSPSMSAFSEGTQFTVLGRKQWSGISGAPTTGLFSYSGNINGSKLYVNGNFVSDQVSVYNRTNANLGVSYKLAMNTNNHLAVGLSGGFTADKVDLSRASFTEGDNYLDFGLQNQVTATFGTSVTYGNNSLRLTASGGVMDVLYKKNFFGYVGKTWPINELDIHTSLLYKYSAGTDRDQLDLNTLLMYKRTVGVGLGYRMNNEFVIMGRLILKEKYQVGYAYDLAFGKLRGLSGHEIFLRIQLPSKNSSTLIRSGYTNPII